MEDYIQASDLCRLVMGISERHAIRTIERNGYIAFVEKRDRQEFQTFSPTAHSYRIRLTVRNHVVINTDVG